MGEVLLSVGIDVGTTTTQLVVSQLTVENQGSDFTVPQMVIAARQVNYRSPVRLTPLLGEERVDGEALRALVAAEYAAAGIERQQVDTGAVIITGETSRKENARVVLEALAGFAGDFVVATAGPDLESILAAKGAGAVEFSARTGKRLLHMDIGGGTSNLAWIEDGKVIRTGCLNVGGRLIKLDQNGVVTYVSPVLEKLCTLKVGQSVTRQEVEAVVRILVEALEGVAGLRQTLTTAKELWTKEAAQFWTMDAGEVMYSFSGGVADCMEREIPWLRFGDIGPILGQELLQSRLCSGEYRLGSETIRATVIGAGSHSLQLSGSTVFYRDMQLPIKNRPVVCLTEEEQASPELPQRIRERLQRQDEAAVVYLPGLPTPSYAQVAQLGQKIAKGFNGQPILVALAEDMGKALGQSMAMLTEQPVLCMDGLRLLPESYLDVGAPVGTALPVVIKTLILEG